MSVKRSQVQLAQLKGPLRRGSAVDDQRQTIEEVFGAGDTRIALNLAEMPMIDSSGIGLLVFFLASSKQRGGNIKLVNPSKFAVQFLLMERPLLVPATRLPRNWFDWKSQNKNEWK